MKYIGKDKNYEEQRRTSHEVRGLKYHMKLLILPLYRRTSHEVRGLKYDKKDGRQYTHMSHLTRGAWIEIYTYIGEYKKYFVAPHTRCVD